MTEDVLLTALYSISDNNSFLLFNRDPITRMIQYLKVHICPRHESAQIAGRSCMLGVVRIKQHPSAATR